MKGRVNAARKADKPIAPTSINIYGRVMNSFLNWMHAEEILKFKWKLTPIKEQTGQRRKVFNDQDVEAFIKYRPTSFNQTRAHTLGLCMLDNGVRIDEALSITPEDVDFTSDHIKIVGKGNKVRYVPISNSFRTILYKYITRIKPKGCKYVFGTHVGTKMSQRNALRDIRVVEGKAGIQSLSWHSYRHSFATGFINRGGDVYKLQRILGHSDIRTTEKYLHLSTQFITKGHDNFSSLTPIRK
jgi:integrase/recombinase XerD